MFLDYGLKVKAQWFYDEIIKIINQTQLIQFFQQNQKINEF